MSHENYFRAETVTGGSNRSFGLVFTGVFFFIALSPLFSGDSIRYWALVAGGVFLLVSWVNPSLLSVLNCLWTAFGRLLHKIVNPLVLAALFYLVFTPYAIVMRIFGKDHLRLAKDPHAESYWQKRTVTVQNMKRQF